MLDPKLQPRSAKPLFFFGRLPMVSMQGLKMRAYKHDPAGCLAGLAAGQGPLLLGLRGHAGLNVATPSLSVSAYTHIYIYIWIHVYVYIYIYVSIDNLIARLSVFSP